MKLIIANPLRVTLYLIICFNDGLLEIYNYIFTFKYELVNDSWFTWLDFMDDFYNLPSTRM